VFIDHKDNINHNINHNINDTQSKPILANEVYVADISDEETTDEEEVLIGYYDCN
jgi:hypothetical protein